MNLPAAIHAHLVEHKATFEVPELVHVFRCRADEIERALRQLERDGKAQHDGDEWRMNLPKQVQQKELFA